MGEYLRDMSAMTVAIHFLFPDEQMEEELGRKRPTSHPGQKAPPHTARPPKSGYEKISVTEKPIEQSSRTCWI